jgi:hypothetical protein
MSSAVTNSASLSSRRCRRLILPTERSVAPPILRALGDVVGHREDLLRLLVEQQVVIAEVWTRHVPVEVLGLQIEREGIGHQCPQRRGDVLDRIGTQFGRRLELCSFSVPERRWRSWRAPLWVEDKQLWTGSVGSGPASAL